jgi:RND family efflux transporter MFP subunit
MSELENRTEASVGPRAPSRPRLGRLALGAGLLVIVTLVAGYLLRARPRAEVRREMLELAIPTVAVVTPVPSKADGDLMLPAEIAPASEASIHARASGYLKRWLVDIGARVEAGQLLAEIDAPEGNEELAIARAQLVQAEAALALARTTSARWEEAAKTASVSDQEAAEKQADLALKSAAVESGRAQVRRLEDLLSYTRVTAPFAGTITARNIDVGDLVVANSGKELFHLAQTRTLRVYVRLPQSMVSGVTVGQSIEIVIPEHAGKKYPAKVVRTAGAIASDSRTLLVELEVDNPNGEILAGSFARASFGRAWAAAHLTVPANTLLFRPEGPQVGVVQRNGVVDLRTVKLGRDYGSRIEIVSGVGAQDRIVSNPSDMLSSGDTVRVVTTSAAGEGK